VAVTKEGIPCFHLWLIDASQNEKLKKVWGDIFPRLNPDEFLVENVYTVPKFRGAGIFPAVLHEIAEKSKALGAKYLISFGETSNVNMSRSFAYAGFFPYVLRTKKNFLFNRSIFFKDIPDELMSDYNGYTAAFRAKPKKKEEG
jgi:GNAT superfamily N-acetyltransferase